MPTYVSLFSGIAGLDLGLHRAGWTCQAMCEIEPHARTVLTRHFPAVPILEDIKNATAALLGPVPDAVLAGVPCKDTSIAGARAGFAGARSGLYYDTIRIVREWVASHGYGPEWIVIENPDGILTSNQGRDWLTVTSDLADLGYGWAYRVVDARDHGSVHKRLRVLLVAHRGGDPTVAGSVLGVIRDRGEAAAPDRVEPGRRPGARPPATDSDAGSLPDGTMIFRKSARARKSLDRGGYETWVPAAYANTLTAFDGGGPARQTHLVVHPDGRVRTLTVTEWERLCGFPDGWTEGMPDAARFTALGNCVHVATGEWLAAGLDSVHAATVAAATA